MHIASAIGAVSLRGRPVLAKIVSQMLFRLFVLFLLLRACCVATGSCAVDVFCVASRASILKRRGVS